MAKIVFTVPHRFSHPSETVWLEMTDWARNGDWIPATRMEVEPGDQRHVGAKFTAYTGYGPLTLVDHMQVAEINWSAESQSGTCEVEKLGPVLKGRAGFTVEPDGPGSVVEWFEDVELPIVPGFTAPIIAKLSALGFSAGMRSLAKSLSASTQSP